MDSLSEDHKEKRQPGAVMSFLVFGAAIAVLLLGVVLLDYDIHIVAALAPWPWCALLRYLWATASWTCGLYEEIPGPGPGQLSYLYLSVS